MTLCSVDPAKFIFFVCLPLQELQKEKTSYLSSLCELLGTSHTSVLTVPPIVIPEDCMFVSGSVDVDVRGESFFFCRYLFQ